MIVINMVKPQPLHLRQPTSLSIILNRMPAIHRIRISASSCVKLHTTDNKLVLELNRSRFRDGLLQITPLGGGILINANSVTALSQCEIEFERPPDNAGRYDIRLSLNYKSLNIFRSWFHARHEEERECSANRELLEELVDEHELRISGPMTEEWIGCREYFALSNNPANAETPTFFIQEIFAIKPSILDMPVIDGKCAAFNFQAPGKNRLLALDERAIASGQSIEGISIALTCRGLL